MTVTATEAKVSSSLVCSFLFCFMCFSFKMTTRNFYVITFKQITAWLPYSRALKKPGMQHGTDDSHTKGTEPPVTKQSNTLLGRKESQKQMTRREKKKNLRRYKLKISHLQ